MKIEGMHVTVDEYHAMVARGSFANDEAYELLENTIVRRRRQTPGHCSVRGHFVDAVELILPTGWHIRQRSGFTMPDSETEPDVVIVRGEIFDYARRHPGPRDIALLVEIKTTEMHDLETRVRVYQRAGVFPFWILDIDSGEVTAYGPPNAIKPVTLRQRDALPRPECFPSGHGLTVADVMPHLCRDEGN